MDYKMYSFSNFGIASNLCQKKKMKLESIILDMLYKAYALYIFIYVYIYTCVYVYMDIYHSLKNFFF